MEDGDRPSLTGSAFEHQSGFDAGDVHGGIRLGKFEAQYEELFAVVIEDGIITPEERAQLDKAADNMGLDRARLRKLESALQSAWEAHHQVKVVVQASGANITYTEEDEGRASLVPFAPVVAKAPLSAIALSQAPTRPDSPTEILKRRIAELESRVKQLEAELEAVQNDAVIEIDLGMDVSGATVVAHDDDPIDLQRRIRQDPTDAEPMRLLFRHYAKLNETDKAWCVASALVVLGRANPEEKALYELHRQGTIPKFKNALSPDAWRRLLFHPDEETLTGDIFAVITSAVLLGRVSALRRDKLLPKLNAERRQDPEKSTLSAVRAVTWAAAILGMRAPPIYVDPDATNIGIEMVPGIPPNLRVGARLLSGRTPLEVAFESGRMLACFREEHFVRWLFPGIPDLEDLFLAALTLGSPTLPIPAHAKARVAPIARAIEPVLEPAQVDRLRGYFLRFVEEGGRTNLQRWAHGVDRTACRAGLLLCNDLPTAGKILSVEEKSSQHAGVGGPGERMLDLLVYVTSDRCFSLRRQLGIAIGS